MIKDLITNTKIIKKICFILIFLIDNISILKRVVDLLNFKAKIYPIKIITARINGGLGNQLFQIANVISYAWEHSMTPLLAKIKKSPSYGKKTRPVYWKTVFRNIPVSKSIPSKLVIFEEKGFMYCELPSPDQITILKDKNGIIFHGYFQSAKYFDQHRERVLSMIFYIDPLDHDYLKKKYKNIFNEESITVAVHFRRGDLVSHSITEIFPHLWDSKYYQKAIAYFQEKFGVENLILVIFSDDISWSKKYMKENFPNITHLYPQEKDYLDLFLMSCCKHQIIANSSFSWWAAYLNKNSEKIVISPKNWFGPQGPHNWDDLYMDNWIKL